MAFEALPANAKIVELQLAVGTTSGSERRPLNKSRAVGPSITEMWHGQIALQTMHATDARAFAAWLEGRDGKVQAFSVPAKQGFATHAGAYAGVTAATLAGSGTLSVTGPAGVAVRAGTLLAIGTVGETGYQIVEVLDTVTTTAVTTFAVAPRIRNTLTVGVAVTAGDVAFALVLARDEVGMSWDLQRGVATLDVLEALL